MTSTSTTSVISILGASDAIASVRRQVELVARSRLPVVIEGETGTGKELVAQAIHAGSGRRGAFIAVNASAIPDTLFEAEMFGYRRGAFTGAASSSEGLVRAARDGTMLLDEIGSLALPLQAKLLRVIDTGRVSALGTTSSVPVDVRYVAACNSDLEAAVGAELFRSDLWYRLQGFRIVLPPLRERRMDIPVLAGHFVAAAAAEGMAPLASLAPSGAQVLQRHDWPGNVRELRLVVVRAMVLTSNRVLDSDVIIEALAMSNMRTSPVGVRATTSEAAELRAFLESCDWDTLRAAAALGVTRKTIYARIRRLGLTIPRKWHRRRIAGAA
jgi:transcriptional regulator with PAS, ATPase and Fis domain